MAVARAVDLRRVAEWTGTTIDEIQALNPELRRWTTPVKYPDYELKVPPGTAELFSAHLSERVDLRSRLAELAHGQEWGDPRRRSRESSASAGSTWRKRTLSSVRRVRAGQELVIPRAPATLLASRADRPAPTAVASRAISAPAPVATADRPDAQRSPPPTIASSGATRSSRSPGCSTRPSPRSEPEQPSRKSISVGDSR